MGENGVSVTKGSLFVSAERVEKGLEIVKTGRVGVKDDRKLRFFVKDSEFVSGRP